MKALGRFVREVSADTRYKQRMRAVGGDLEAGYLAATKLAAAGALNSRAVDVLCKVYSRGVLTGDDLRALQADGVQVRL